MEGTWGRRVYGRIVKGEENTLFSLEIQMSSLHQCRIFVPNKELELYPGSYKTVLDAMVRSLEVELESYYRYEPPNILNDKRINHGSINEDR